METNEVARRPGEGSSRIRAAPLQAIMELRAADLEAITPLFLETVPAHGARREV